MLISICAIVERTITGCRVKFKVLVMKQKLFQLKWKGGKISRPTGKGNKWTILCIGGENLAADLNFGKNQPRGSGVSKQLCRALTIETLRYNDGNGDGYVCPLNAPLRMRFTSCWRCQGKARTSVNEFFR